jgi:thiamine kinase-like enzyme
MRAPRCLGIRMMGGDRCGVWLEDVQGIPATRWECRRLIDAARHLGVFQGTFVAVHRVLPCHAWFCRPFIESNGPACRAEFLSRLDDDQLWADPLIRATHDRSVLSLAKRVWKHHATLVQAVRRLPKTLCHWDFAPQNLLADDRAKPTTVVLDWGALASDPPVRISASWSARAPATR